VDMRDAEGAVRASATWPRSRRVLAAPHAA